MKKFLITVKQEIELPDECSVIEGSNGKFIKLGNKYLMPSVEFLQSNKYSENKMEFIELDEDLCDVIYASINRVESLIDEK